jgi:hypothetical protein
VNEKLAGLENLEDVIIKLKEYKEEEKGKENKFW